MDKKAERAAKKRLKGKIWMTRGAPSLKGRRRLSPLGKVDELQTGHIPQPEQLDGWNPEWGSRPGSWYDPDRAYQDGDWEWIPGDEGDRLRAIIRGRKRQAGVQIDERDERKRAEQATRRVLLAEAGDQQNVWRMLMLDEVPVTNKQRAFLSGEIDLARDARSRMLGRIHDRARKHFRGCLEKRST